MDSRDNLTAPAARWELALRETSALGDPSVRHRLPVLHVSGDRGSGSLQGRHTGDPVHVEGGEGSDGESALARGAARAIPLFVRAHVAATRAARTGGPSVLWLLYL